MICRTCKGIDSDRWYRGKRHVCLACNGSGYEPTSFGLKVVELMRHQFAQIAEEAGAS